MPSNCRKFIVKIRILKEFLKQIEHLCYIYFIILDIPTLFTARHNLWGMLRKCRQFLQFHKKLFTKHNHIRSSIRHYRIMFKDKKEI